MAENMAAYVMKNLRVQKPSACMSFLSALMRCSMIARPLWPRQSVAASSVRWGTHTRKVSPCTLMSRWPATLLSSRYSSRTTTKRRVSLQPCNLSVKMLTAWPLPRSRHTSAELCSRALSAVVMRATMM